MSNEVRISHPPAVVLKVVNPITRSLLQSRLATRMTGQALMHFSGQRTGAGYTVVVSSWHEFQGEHVIVSPARWRRNFAGGAPLVVRHGGVDIRGRGVLDADPDHVAAVANGLLSAGISQRALGLKVPAGHRISPADVAAIHLGVVRFEPSRP